MIHRQYNMDHKHWCMRNIDYEQVNFFPGPVKKIHTQVGITILFFKARNRPACNVYRVSITNRPIYWWIQEFVNGWGAPIVQGENSLQFWQKISM